MSLEIKYIDAPEGAQETMAFSTSEENAISNAAGVPGGTADIPWATLEPGCWVLDGSRKLLSDAPTETGWWSCQRSGEDGRFAAAPRLTLKFPAPYSATGLTFTFSPSTEQWCSEIRVAWYNDQTLLAEGTYYPDSPSWILSRTVESFDQIQIDLIATNNPGQFAKLQCMEVGQTILFGKEELIAVQLVNEIDPTLCVLSADTMSFEIVDRKGRDLIPQENQRIELFKDGRLKAVQYISSGTRNSKNQYKIDCQSMIGLLEDTFLGGLYSDKPLAELAGEILGDWPFEISPYFSTTTVSGYLPVCTQREALQQIAFAIGAVITTQDGAKIRFLPLLETTVGAFSEADIFMGASVKMEPRVAKVEVYSHSYTPSDKADTILEEEISGENVLVTFDEPHHSYEITGGEITASDVNWVRVTAGGPVTVTAKPFLHSSVAHTKRNAEALAKEQSNCVSIPEVTLIHKGNVQQVLTRLFNIQQMRQTTEQEVVVKDQKAGDLVVSSTPWNGKTRGYISSMDSTLSQNSHTAKVCIQGVMVTVEAVYFCSGDVFAGEKEVVY